MNAGLPSLVIAIVITDAFHCVWHRSLLDKRLQLGVTECLLYLLFSCKTESSLRIAVNGCILTNIPAEAFFHRNLSSDQWWNIYYSDLLQITPTPNADSDDYTFFRKHIRGSRPMT